MGASLGHENKAFHATTRRKALLAAVLLTTSLVESAHAAPPPSDTPAPTHPAPLPAAASAAAPPTGDAPLPPTVSAAPPPSTAPPATAPVAYPPGTPPPGYYYAQQPVPFVTVAIRSTVEPLVVELYNPSARPLVDLPIARCQVPCRAHLPVGRYKLFVHETEDTLSGARIIDISGTANVLVSPDARGQRTAGLGLGIGGVVAMVVGAVLVLSDLCVDGCSRYDDGTDGRAGVGTALLLGGLVATPVGWVMFGKSFRPEVTQMPAAQVGLSPTVFTTSRGTATDHVPGLVLNGRF